MVLNRECDTLICVLYKEYLTRRKNNVLLSRSRYFRDDASIRENFLPQWYEEDVATLCWDLYDKGLLDVTRGDDKANDVSLTADGIAYMEQRFPNGIKMVADYLMKLAQSVAPWLV